MCRSMPRVGWRGRSLITTLPIDSVEVGRSTGETVMLPLSVEALVAIDRQNKRLTVRHSFVEELL